MSSAEFRCFFDYMVDFSIKTNRVYHEDEEKEELIEDVFRKNAQFKKYHYIIKEKEW